MSKPKQSPPRCSIVIRAYNEEVHLGRLLEGIASQTVKDVEIILVDSGSTDRTVEIAQQYSVNLVYIDSAEFTFGRSLNRGIAAASREIVVIASAHVSPLSTDWLEKLLAPFSNPQVALTYGAQRGEESTKFSERQFFAQYFTAVSNFNQTDPFCNNANAAIRRALWEGHPYDETLTGLEDLAWSSWAKEQGHRIAYVAEAAVAHVHNETYSQIFNRYRREAMAMQRILPQSQYKFRHFLRIYLTHIYKDAAAALHQRVFLKNIIGIKLFRFMQFWGAYWGYNHSKELTPELKQVFYYSPRILTANRASPSEIKKTSDNSSDHQVK